MPLFVRWAAVCVLIGVIAGGTAVALKHAFAPPRPIAVAPAPPPDPADIPRPIVPPAKPDPAAPPLLVPSTAQALDARVGELLKDRTVSAAELIEAALARDPDNRGLRLRAFVIHQAIATAPSRVDTHPTRLARDDAAAAEISRRAAHAFVAALGHLESLIQNRQIDAELALHLVAMVTPDRIRYAYPMGYIPQTQIWFHPGNEHVLAGEKAKERYLLRVHPLILSLPLKHSTVEYGMAFKMRWQRLAAEMVLNRLGTRPRSAEHLALIKQVVARFPPGVRTSDEITHFLRQSDLQSAHRDNYEGTPCTPDEWTALLNDLARHETRAIQAYGKWGLLSQNMRGAEHSRNGVLLKQIVAEADALLDEFQLLPYERNIASESRTQETLFREALRLRNQAASMVIPVIKPRPEPPRTPLSSPQVLFWPTYIATGETLDALSIVPPR